MTNGKDRREEAETLLDAIERDSEAIARLMRSCGSSRNFGVEQQRQFAKLVQHRRHLIGKLEGLRGPQWVK